MEDQEKIPSQDIPAEAPEKTAPEQANVADTDSGEAASQVITQLSRLQYCRLRWANIYSGIGMGLLLGLIMGLSVSPVVKTIMGVLTAMLGAFLGFDRRNFAKVTESEYAKENYNSIFTGLRAGSFGLAVVLGLVGGMLIRGQELLTMSIQQQVKNWTDAGFDKDYALKLVAYERLAIDVKSGEMKEHTEVQKSKMSVLYSSEQAEELCGSMDPAQWGTMSEAQKAFAASDKPALVALAGVLTEVLPADAQYPFLEKLYLVICHMAQADTEFCKLGTNLAAWEGAHPHTRALMDAVRPLSPDHQKKLMEALSEFVCELEKK